MKRIVSGQTRIKISVCFLVFSLTAGLLKVSAQPYTMEWQKAYDFNSQMSTGDEAFDIQPTNDNGYVLAGRTSLDPLWDAKGRVLKLNSAGAVEWDKTFGDSTATCYLNSVRQTQDGGFIALGSLTAMNNATGMANGWHGSYDLFVLKLDASGNVQWHKSLGGSSNEDPGAIRQTADGGYIISGSTSSNDGDVINHHHFNINDPWADIWLVKLNASGNIVWQNTYGGYSDESAGSIEILQDGSFIVCGNTSSNDGDVSGNHSISTDGWVIKVSATGTLLWQKCLGSTGEERLFDIKPTADNGFITTGYSGAEGGDITGFHGFFDGWVIKLNSSGNIEWQRSIGGSGRDMAGSVKQLANGSYVVAGESNSTDGDVPATLGLRDIWVCYLSNNGNITDTQDFGGPDNDGYLSGWYAMFLGVTIIPTHADGLAVAACTQSNNIPGFVDNGDFYLIKLKGNGGCDTSFTVSDTIICNNSPLLVTLNSSVVGANSYRWVNSVTGPTVTVTLPGTYFCNALTGCNFHVDTIHVLLPTTLPEDLGLTDMDVCSGSDFILGNKIPIKGIQYLWNTGEQQSFIHPIDAGTYSLTVSNDCDNKVDSAHIILIECDQCLFIPNAFSPNADGTNDAFMVRNLCEIKSFQLQVFNRWGQAVFQTYDITQPWDGTFHNRPADAGVYFYQISFTTDNGSIQYKKGDLTLIR